MYEFHTELNPPFGPALEKVRATLLVVHLLNVSDVDLEAIFKHKMDKVIPACHIYGACDRNLAERVIRAEPNAATQLPCNFIMRETRMGGAVVDLMHPVAVLGITIRCSQGRGKRETAAGGGKTERLNRF